MLDLELKYQLLWVNALYWYIYNFPSIAYVVSEDKTCYLMPQWAALTKISVL